MDSRFVVPLFLAIAAPAHAGELSLADALAGVSSVRSVQTAALQRASAEAAVLQAAGAFDPDLSWTTDASGNAASGYVAGYPVDSRSTGVDMGLTVQGELPSSTTWSVSMDLGYDTTTTVSELAGDATEQVRSNWDGLVSLTVGQDLLAPLRRSDLSIRRRQAQDAADVAALQAAQAEEDALEAVADLWWTWAAAWRQTRTAEAALASAERLVGSTQALADEGQVAQLEVRRVEADRLDAERTTLQARTAERQAADALLSRLGLPFDAALTPSGSGAIAAGSLDVHDAEAQAVDADLDVAIARRQVQTEQTDLRDARATWLPSLDLSGTVGVASLADTAATAVTALGTDPLPRWGVGLSVSVPLGGRAARGAVQTASAQLGVAELAVDDAEAAARLAIRAALDDMALARASVALTTAQLDVARQTEDGEQARLEEGLTRLDDLLDARHARVQAEVAVIDAEADRARAELAVLRRLGRLGDLAATGGTR
ncbi:MAG: TolC family protein [Alphaproteobacteria bacterium]|nr:TolC family protein [Alphaproteobacteria bacterium]